MKKAGLLLLCCAFAVVLVCVTSSVNARPQYNKEHLKKYEGAPVEDALKEAKCNACHYGKSKKNRNDYGKALEKAGLTKAKFDELKGDGDALSDHVQKALEKVLEGDAGKEFSDRIKAGKLPADNPE